MSTPVQTESPAHARFPGFDVLSQQNAWDPVTTGLVRGRLTPPAGSPFFSADERATVAALVDLLLDLGDRPAVPVVEMVEDRLAHGRTDGWHYEDLPEDGQAWRASLAHLDADARGAFGSPFAATCREDRAALLAAVHDRRSADWHGLPAQHVWNLWLRYACTAFYSHPTAWNEIGFPGPAYPRGYKNARLGGREPFEVADVRPSEDPATGGGS